MFECCEKVPSRTYIPGGCDHHVRHPYTPPSCILLLLGERSDGLKKALSYSIVPVPAEVVERSEWKKSPVQGVTGTGRYIGGGCDHHVRKQAGRRIILDLLSRTRFRSHLHKSHARGTVAMLMEDSWRREGWIIGRQRERTNNHRFST